MTDVDKWIEKLHVCQFLTEVELKQLCDRVSGRVVTVVFPLIFPFAPSSTIRILQFGFFFCLLYGAVVVVAFLSVLKDSL